MCRTLPGHSTRKHCQILPFLSLRFIQFSDNECAICILSAWTFAVFFFDKLDFKFAYRLFGSDGITKIFTFLWANLRWYIHLSIIFVAMESQYSMLLGWMILSSILTTQCYYHNLGKSNEQTLHEKTTYSCWHAGANNEQTSLRTTAPIFQSQTVWSVVALKFWRNGPCSKFLMLSSENFGDMISFWSPGLVSENPDDIPRSLWLVSW